MNHSQFEQKVQKAQKSFKVIEQNANSSSKWSKSLQSRTIAELAIALEELHVAAEELQQQNEELLATRLEVEEERQRYLDLFESAPMGYLVTDKRGIIEEANSTAQKMLKVRQDLMVGKPLILFVAETDRQFFHEQLNRLAQIDKLQDWETILQPRGGDIFPGMIAVSTIYNSQGKAIGLRWLIRDITERKQAEETRRRFDREKALSELKSRMLRTISYELCTPLNVISLSTQLLNAYKNELEPVKVEVLFQKINAALGTLFHLSDDSLFFSRLEEGKEDWKPETLDLEQYCHNLVTQMQLRATGEREIRFLSHARHSTVYMDRQFLQQILENLLVNALKYSFKRSIIHFELRVRDDTIIFRIQDSGIGIPEEDRPYLFEPFYRGKNVENTPGIGLGLSMVKKAVDLCEGAIAFESEVGVGTCFTVTLPLKGREGGERKRRGDEDVVSEIVPTL